MGNTMKKYFVYVGIILFVGLLLFVYYNLNSNKEKQWILFGGPKTELKEVDPEVISYGLDLTYKATEEILSSDNDYVRLAQDAKDELYLFNKDVLSYKGACSSYDSNPCSFEVYRSYSVDYVNEYGVSDHIGGYDVDLKLPDISRGQMKGHNTGDYIIENAYRFGFINRYLYESNRADQYSHFRYVGYENALLIKNLGMSVEDYIESFKLNRVYYVQSSDTYMYRTSFKDGKAKLPSNEYKAFVLNDKEILIITKK